MICPGCPWRLDVEPGGGAIPGFSIDLMRGLANTVGDGDAFRPIMACHHSRDGAERPCGGYLAVEGYSNLAVRLAVANGRIPSDALGPEAHDLWPSFAAMLDAYEEALTDGV